MTAAPDAQPAHLASTVVLLRDTDSSRSFDVLMLRRNAEGKFGGMWVFPGGRVDPDDGIGDDAFVAAAVREVHEEAGLELEPSALTPFSFWSPRGTGKRFNTMFFAALSPAGDVVLDGVEVEEYVWASPSHLLDAHGAGTLSLVPPTWRTLAWLASLDSAGAVIEAARVQGVVNFTGHVKVNGDGERVVLWQGDAAYDGNDLDIPGPRHRLYMNDLPWRLELSGADHGGGLPAF